MRSTQEWEKALEEATPGPWFANIRGFGRIENIGPISTGFSMGDGLDCDEADADLAALAPEAVAEVVRLRRELERLREDMDRRERLAGAFGVSSLVESIVSSKITRILEGTNE